MLRVHVLSQIELSQDDSLTDITAVLFTVSGGAAHLSQVRDWFLVKSTSIRCPVVVKFLRVVTYLGPFSSFFLALRLLWLNCSTFDFFLHRLL